MGTSGYAYRLLLNQYGIKEFTCLMHLFLMSLGWFNLTEPPQSVKVSHRLTKVWICSQLSASMPLIQLEVLLIGWRESQHAAKCLRPCHLSSWKCQTKVYIGWRESHHAAKRGPPVARDEESV